MKIAESPTASIARRQIDQRVPLETLAYAGLMLTSCVWASAFIAGKVALAELNPLNAAAARYVIAAGVLLPFAVRGRPTAANLRRVATPLIVMIVCGGILYPWLFLLALGRTSATNTSLLIALNPALTMLLSPFAGDAIERRRLGGLLLALAGAVVVITQGKWEHVRELASLSLRGGDLLAVAAAFCWACFNVGARRVVVHLTPSFINAVTYGTGGMLLSMAAWTSGGWQQLAAASPTAWASVLVMAVGSSVLAGQLFLFGVRTVGVNRSVVFVYLTPVFTALCSLALLGEPLLVVQGIGGAAVLAGVYSATRR